MIIVWRFLLERVYQKIQRQKELKLPTRNDLIADLKKDLELTDETDFLKITQLYYLGFKEHSYLKKLKDYFSDNIRPSLIHKQESIYR